MTCHVKSDYGLKQMEIDLKKDEVGPAVEEELPEKRGDPQADREKQWRDLVEERILEAQKRGDFDNLRGKGRPLNLEGNPWAGDWEMAFKILANAGFAPEWIERDKEIRRELDAAARMLVNHIEWERQGRTNLARLPFNMRAEREAHMLYVREQTIARYRRKAAAINRLIFNFNLMAPSPQVHRQRIDIEAEVRKFETEVGS